MGHPPHSSDECLTVTMNAVDIRWDDVITRCWHLTLPGGHQKFLTSGDTETAAAAGSACRYAHNSVNRNAPSINSTPLILNILADNNLPIFGESARTSYQWRKLNFQYSAYFRPRVKINFGWKKLFSLFANQYWLNDMVMSSFRTFWYSGIQDICG
jgi:hypothetical protein